jgi:hypothetical protein
MKKLLLTGFLALFVFLQTAGAQTSYPNHPLPQRPDTLRILAIGNSFSDDATEYLPGLLEAAGIHNIILGRLYIGGCTLERHCQEFETDGHEYVYKKSVANQWETIKKYKEGSFMDGLGDEPWDIVTLQQGSPKSGRWDSYDPWLPKLIEIVRQNCPNPNATIVWHQTWAYAHDYENRSFANYTYSQELMYACIESCVKKLRKDYDIPVVMASGVAVQNLRKRNFPTEREFTRDGFHMDYKYGRYLTACVWFETLIRPVFGISVKGNSFRNQGTGNELTQKEARTLQKAAVQASQYWK